MILKYKLQKYVRQQNMFITKNDCCRGSDNRPDRSKMNDVSETWPDTCLDEVLDKVCWHMTENDLQFLGLAGNEA